MIVWWVFHNMLSNLNEKSANFALFFLEYKQVHLIVDSTLVKFKTKIQHLIFLLLQGLGLSTRPVHRVIRQFARD